MGSPLGPSLANFFLGHLEKDEIMYSDFTPQFYNRYVDDICSIFYSSDSFQKFLDFDLNENIKFTVEHASINFRFVMLNLNLMILILIPGCTENRHIQVNYLILLQFVQISGKKD